MIVRVSIRLKKKVELASRVVVAEWVLESDWKWIKCKMWCLWGGLWSISNDDDILGKRKSRWVKVLSFSDLSEFWPKFTPCSLFVCLPVQLHSAPMRRRGLLPLLVLWPSTSVTHSTSCHLLSLWLKKTPPHGTMRWITEEALWISSCRLQFSGRCFPSAEDAAAAAAKHLNSSFQSSRSWDDERWRVKNRLVRVYAPLLGPSHVCRGFFPLFSVSPNICPSISLLSIPPFLRPSLRLFSVFGIYCYPSLFPSVSSSAPVRRLKW